MKNTDKKNAARNATRNTGKKPAIMHTEEEMKTITETTATQLPAPPAEVNIDPAIVADFTSIQHDTAGLEENAAPAEAAATTDLHADRKAKREAAAAKAKAERAAAKAKKDAANTARLAQLEASKASKKADAKPTRAATFKAIISEGPITKKALAQEMQKRYGGSEAEANFQTDSMARLLLEMGFAVKNADGKLQLVTAAPAEAAAPIINS